MPDERQLLHLSFLLFKTSIAMWCVCTGVHWRGPNGATVPGIQGRGHPKSEISKIYILLKFCNYMNLRIVRLLTYTAWIW